MDGPLKGRSDNPEEQKLTEEEKETRKVWWSLIEDHNEMHGSPLH